MFFETSSICIDIHYYRVRKMKCLECKSDTSNPKFCSSSCAARFNNRKFPKRSRSKNKLQDCLNCNKTLSGSQNKFCSIECSGEHLYKTKSIPKILKGNCTNVIALKRYLRETRGDMCEICKCPPIHNGLPLVLQLDHKDGNSDNNKITNLRLVCPNCHTQTETFATRQKKPHKRNRYLRKYKSGQVA